MKLSRLFMAHIGRAVIMAFAAQVVAGAMCLMPAVAMAGPQASSMDAMPACTVHHAVHHVRHACPHCDAPVQAVSQIDISHGLQAPTWVPVVLTLPVQPVVAAPAAVVFAPRILAPPDSRHLILHRTLRIRI